MSRGPKRPGSPCCPKCGARLFACPMFGRLTHRYRTRTVVRLAKGAVIETGSEAYNATCPRDLFNVNIYEGVGK